MDNLTKEQRHKNMQNIRSRNTKPERLVAKELRKRKIHFSQYSNSVIGKPDFIFRKKKVAVFIDSDFWHGHPKRLIVPKSNRIYWQQKIKNNRLRDKKVNAYLKKSGWTVIRIWTHDLKCNFERAFHRILGTLKNK